jgi:proteic killer suppression protein
MIVSIVHKGLCEIYETGSSRRVRTDQHRRCFMILNALKMAKCLEDVNIPSFAFHGLQGNPKRYAVKVNKNWRITFGWDDGAVGVNLEDYH